MRTSSRLRTGLCVLFCIVASAHLLAAAEPTPVSNGKPLPGTRPLGIPGDLAEYMIGGVDRFLLRELDLSIDRRASLWHRDISSKAAYQKSVEPNRRHFARIIGLQDQRPPFNDLELVGTLAEPALVGRGDGFRVLAVRWPALDGVHGEGLLLEPTRRPFRASVVVVPDCEQTPEALVGLAAGVPAENQIARRLAENGCRVLVPTLINRGHELSIAGHGKQHSTATHREMLYRAAYQMGRHLIGYEVQKIRRGGRLVRKDERAPRSRSASSVTAKEDCSHCTPPRSIRGSTSPASAVISTAGRMSGRSRSTATCSGCSVNSAMPNWPR